MFNSTRILGLAVIIEAAIIIVLAVSHYRIVLQPRLTPVAPLEHPLNLALEYDSSDQKFEQLVKDDPESMHYVCPLYNIPILATCALAKKTNYVRILIRNGADTTQAIKSLQKLDADEPLKLIREVELERSNQKTK